MKSLIGLVQDYKANIPLHMLANKYKVPIHTIIETLYELNINQRIKNGKYYFKVKSLSKRTI